MAYTLQAFVLPRSSLENGGSAVFPGLVELNQGLAMIPMTSALRAATGIPFLPLTEGGEKAMPHSLIALCKKIALPGIVLYLEAEYFGGVGTQACAVINGGELVSGPIVGADAINSALALVGVNVSEDEDGFRVVGLNKYRDTDQWITGS